jgi:maltose O-acetyltransferase
MCTFVRIVGTIVRMTTTDHFAGDPRTNRERMLAGDLYVADDPESHRIAQRATARLEDYRLAVVRGEPGAREILADVLGTLGEGAHVRPPLAVDYGENLHVGERTFVNVGLVALDVATITLGADCQIGPNVQLLTPTHPIDPVPRRDKLEAARPITLGDNVWLGGGVIVCPGVTIGDNTVVGAGAVVTRDLPANVVAVGNPARVIRENIDRPTPPEPTP